MAVKKKRGPKSLSAGRPPTFKPSTTSFSRKSSRTVINKLHVLEKKRHRAIRSGDETGAATAAAEIAALGGLDQYQRASLQGQSKDRGGDSSRILLDWLQPFLQTKDRGGPGAARIRMLEVGALSTTNACAASGYFDTVHIDLNSQEPGILQQDFMERPLPRGDDDGGRFDIISLSLVLNFVPDPVGRGSMLRRTTEFLRGRGQHLEGGEDLFPSLFIVLPRSCLLNSRYCTEERFKNIMTSLGYAQVQSKITQKLLYSLWRRDATHGSSSKELEFEKKEINPGPKRNNFAIVLKNR